MGLEIGPWLQDLKQAIREGAPDDAKIKALRTSTEDSEQAPLALGDLRQLVKVSPGQKIAYITDIGFTPDNVDKAVSLAANADYLIIETPFLHEDAEIAAKKMHLTAHQAGLIAARANVRKFEQFHFSPRYEGQAARLYEEAAQSAQQSETSDQSGRRNTNR